MVLRGFKFLVLALATLSSLVATSGSCDSFDVIGVTIRVVDGDTFIVRVECVSGKLTSVIGASLEYRVRLADINAPELSTPEGVASRDALDRLLHGRTVLLDVDDVSVFDRYGRLVAVAYIEYNNTHLLNVNKWLIDSGYARVWDHVNEFKPQDWELYVVKQTEPTGTPHESPREHTLDPKTLLAILTLILLTTLLIILAKRRS